MARKRQNVVMRQVEKVDEVIQEHPKSAIAITAILASLGSWLGPLLRVLSPLIGVSCQ